MYKPVHFPLMTSVSSKSFWTTWWWVSWSSSSIIIVNNHYNHHRHWQHKLDQNNKICQRKKHKLSWVKLGVKVEINEQLNTKMKNKENMKWNSLFVLLLPARQPVKPLFNAHLRKMLEHVKLQREKFKQNKGEENTKRNQLVDCYSQKNVT